MSERFKIRRALLSVSDKEGLEKLAQRLAAHGVELVSTGGTAKAIKAAGLDVRDVSDLTGYPEMMDGRVKTLHPAVHGGLLFRRDLDTHIQDAETHGIVPIDLVYINLYPFEATVAGGADFETCIENIDIGGPAMLRAAAKNGDSVAVCTDREDVLAVLGEMDSGKGLIPRALGRKLAAKTYARTAAYDAAISGWYAAQLEENAPDWMAFGGGLSQSLRYGENPHQSAAFYKTGDKRPGVSNARQVQGKELSYNNINDTDAAYELIGELGDETPAVAIIKHANPCGVALGETAIEAYRQALACDSTSAFGGIVALNRMLDAETAEEITKVFTEVVIAPGADNGALSVFEKKKNLRLLLTNGIPDPSARGKVVKSVAGGLLVQDRDFGRIDIEDLRVVTDKAPSEQELKDLIFAWRVAKHVKSNTIVYAKDLATVGIGAGQMSRIDSARIAARKAEDAAEVAGWPEPKTKGCVAASDAFFPFPDGLLQAASAGATAVIQPGGSIRDEEVIKAANEAGIAMVLTGMRHFRH
ncbi:MULTISPECIES: bifunctional phosphoribosylaminoimidazolecarboxamide formyltransferase/IMP cyclohydrolase [Henriciella]|jgi:phosphoribosylaminoimidazolecarboxamide formyltransferase/IMP cyclohydrolase|uniref:Bifunctional purine biosynthesis protein PurH n=1 Tax=Henriciella pelagia TaxID=1977912 RepID=A0ABQ1JN53_9PROT|nr:bifunctional phosphoribosylaminoimidazolecarboxamide formyltransferase/IMP cyclohydrolase [Henriciella pelagia]GGB73243.1 bifunctional purine biosynthesis protein PurH [Henriciella pelagia]